MMRHAELDSDYQKRAVRNKAENRKHWAGYGRATMKKKVLSTILFWLLGLSLAQAQYVRDDCTTLSVSATTKATCFDYNTKILYYWNGSSWATSSAAGAVTAVTGTPPIASSGGSAPAISIGNAAADGTTKGAATFTANDFDASTGVISIDYTNGQAASGSNKGFLTSTDWTTFNNKGAGTVTSIATTSPITGGTITGTGTIACATCVTGAAGSDTQIQYNSSNAFAGDSTFTFNSSTKRITLQGLAFTKEVLSPVTEVTMSGTLTLTANSSTTYQFLDPNGSDRQVNLPAAATGMVYFIMNVGSANILTIKDNGGSTVTTITFGSFNTFVYSGSAWRTI